MKKCPFCAEEIHDEAIKCKHCGEFLQARPPSQEQSRLWYFRNSTVITAILLLMPLALPEPRKRGRKSFGPGACRALRLHKTVSFSI